MATAQTIPSVRPPDAGASLAVVTLDEGRQPMKKNSLNQNPAFRMNSQITRRDFLNGVALSVGASLLPSELLGQISGPDPSAQEYFLSKGITQHDPSYYPPGLTGMRGSHPGSFE